MVLNIKVSFQECNWADVEDMELFGWELYAVNESTSKPIMCTTFTI